MTPVSYPLAPMSKGIYILTLALCALPLGLVIVGVQAGEAVALLPAGLVILIYLFVWLYMRPLRFELSQDALHIIWPLRREAFPLFDVTGVEQLSGQEFRARYGWGMRVGAGGLGGGFGLLVTRRETLRFYVSRLDGYVLVKNRATRTLLITPAEPQTFARSLQEATGRSAAP